MDNYKKPLQVIIPAKGGKFNFFLILIFMHIFIFDIYTTVQKFGVRWF